MLYLRNTLFIFLVLVTVLLLLLSYGIDNYKLHKVQYLKESKCITELVNTSVERKDILFTKGKCIVKENIYYTSKN